MNEQYLRKIENFLLHFRLLKKMSSVLIFGVAVLDYIASVDHFPQPDEKLRTNSLTICGGGNAANTATCLSRLGIKLKLLTKIGDDFNGKKILEEFEKETNIDTSLILIQSSMISPLTYVIVDITSKTRTCLFSANNEQILVNDLNPNWFDQINFIHFDSRSTEAAVHLAKLAKEKSILCSLDLERERPYLDQLIPLMNYIITTENYSRDVCKDSSFIQTAKRFLQTCEFVIITRGKHGSVLIERFNEQTFSPIENHHQEGSIITQEIQEDLLLWNCTAWPIQSDEIIDTTGSGDAFIGGIIYGILAEKLWTKVQLLRFASYIAMCKLKGIGARSSLPYLSEIDRNLFS
jgi:sugar/nucleoside kinase (ribokinase family)